MDTMINVIVIVNVILFAMQWQRLFSALFLLQGISVYCKSGLGLKVGRKSLELALDFLSYIFSVSENTKTIHLIMMIWLFRFIISSYKIVSSPPQDPGGSKKILSKSGYDSQIFLRKNKLSDSFPNEWLKYFQSM